MYKKLNIPTLGVIENMSYFSCPNCKHESDIFGHGGGERMAAELERLAPETLGRSLRKQSKVWLRALDPEYFVRIRNIAGGPAPEAVQAQIAGAKKDQAEAHEWFDDNVPTADSEVAVELADVAARLTVER